MEAGSIPEPKSSLIVSGHLRTVSQDKIKFLFFIKRNRV